MDILDQHLEYINKIPGKRLLPAWTVYFVLLYMLESHNRDGVGLTDPILSHHRPYGLCSTSVQVTLYSSCCQFWQTQVLEISIRQCFCQGFHSGARAVGRLGSIPRQPSVHAKFPEHSVPFVLHCFKI